MNKLEGLKEDLALLEKSLILENKTVDEKLEVMRTELEKQKKMLMESVLSQTLQNEKNKAMLSDLSFFMDSQRKDLDIDKQSLDSLLASLKSP